MTKMLIDRATVEQALEALELYVPKEDYENRPVGNVIDALGAALAEPQPNTLQGWVFKRNADGSIGIFAPPPRPGESPRTSDCVGTNQRDLNELLGKLADHMAALAEPVLQTCNCRWDGEMQMQQCTLHEAHVDAIKEWAQRAKFAEKKLAALAEPVQEPTKAMIDAAERIDWSDADVRGNIINMWQAMIAAAPQPAQQQEPGRLEDFLNKSRAFAHNELSYYRQMTTVEQHDIKGLKVQLESPAQPTQEPVAKCIDDICSEHLGRVEALDHLPRGTILFTTPPQRKPLTDEQKQTIHNETGAGHSLICLVESYINGIKE